MAAISKSHLLATSAIAGLTLLNFASAAQAQDAFGIRNDRPELLPITIAAGETVEGTDTGVFAAAGPVIIENSGTIRGNGVNLGGPTSLPSAGVMIAQGVSTITNGGTISGAANGITTVSFFNAETGQLEGRARDTIVVNTGTISGEGDDGVRLIGGGSVDNAGTITGTGNAGADGISMFPYTDQANADYSASVLNRESGTVTGDRYGIILSAGGEVENAGAVSGGAGGVFIQGTASNVAEGEDRSGLTASVTNTGTISGMGDFGFGGVNGFGVGFGADLASATLVNSGTITSAFNRGVNQGSLADLTVTNAATGRIEGATSGIYSGSGGTLTVVNAGTIRGNGSYDGFDAAPDAGVTIATAGSSVTNSGTISGAGAGITTAFAFDPQANALVSLARDTVVVNTGTISGESNDGVRLIGGGSVDNAGTITGTGNAGADGISMFPYTDQANADYLASVINRQGGTVTGERFGIILSAGGEVENAGAITGATGGVFVQGTALNVAEGEDRSGQVASITNTGTISGTGDFGFGGINGYGVGFGGDLTAATLDNAGTITSAFNAGVRQGSSAELAITNQAGGRIEGATSGIIGAASGALVVVNAGTIHGNGTYDGFEVQPDAGINITAAGSSVVNSGTISGAASGITTAFIPGPQPGQFVGRAIGTVITNSGTISGESNDGVRLIGGGSVDNAGTITGTGNAGADGISMFPYTDQANADYSASVLNRESGTVTGDRYGIILSAGGEVENAGAVSGGAGGVFIQGTASNVAEGEDRSGLTASVTNTGTISGTGDFGFGGVNGFGVGFGADLASATLVNSGTITSAFNRGVNQGSLADLTITNAATGRIEGATSGIYSGSGGTLTVVNAGTIRGNGTYDGFDAAPDAGVTIATAGSSVTNSGTISGAGAGVTSVFFFNPETNSLEGLAVGTAVVNTGTISGESNDGVRLIGGGSLENAGTITGRGGPQADGVSMFRFQDLQLAEGYSASVVNLAGGSIAGDRFGIILSSGGTVDNAGTVTGAVGGVSIQDQAGGGTGVQVASLTNTGTITGANGAGAQFSGALGPVTLANSGSITGTTGGATINTASIASLTNSGTITGDMGHGVQFGLSATGGSITNEATGTITGQTSGVIVQAGVITPGAAVSLVNAGTIRGEGVTTSVQAPFEGGVRLQSGTNSVTNSGTISGAQFGIVTNQVFVPQLQTTAWRVGPTSVTNTGLIEGGTSDAVALFGGGTIVNSGSIAGGSGPGADGIQLQFFPGQDSGLAQIGSIDNQTGGKITGERFGVILAGGGTITNAGAITGGTNAIALVSQNFAGKTGAITNTGTITGGILIDLASAEVTNTGIITNANGAGVQVDGGQVAFVNAGRISGDGTAIRFAAADDELTLLTGSIIEGALDGGEGFDTLFLDGEVLELTEAQQLTATTGFESLRVEAGYWTTSGLVGAFDTVLIDEGAALRINQITVADGQAATSLTAPAIANNGALVLDFADDAVLGEVGAVAVTGSGTLQLVGEGVLSVTGTNLAHTGGTSIINGGLVLTGTLPGDVTTEGDGFFQLGAGGTEGVFAGNVVNSGRFVFNRSDDYDFLGNFSGTGVLDKLGAGVLIFSGEYIFRGITNILAGSVRIGGIIDPTTEFNLDSGGTLDVGGNDQTIAALSGAPEAQVELGQQTLTINQQSNTTFAGTIAGNGGIAKDGDGRLELTGNSTYTGPTNINGGILSVNGSIISPVTVNQGGTLGGNGSVGNTTVAAGGVVAPGNSIGRLTVNGDLAFAAGSIFEVEVNAAGAGDRIDATGRITIASTAQMEVLAEAGTYRPRTDFTVLTAGGGVTGRFGTVTTDLAFLTPFLRYGANAVTLSLYRNDIEFAAVAGNANQIGVARAVQALGIDNPLFEAVLVQDAASARTTFAGLTGELHASTISGLTDDSRHLRNAMLAMPVAAEPGLFAWGSAFGGWGDFDTTAANAGMDTNHNGFVTGIGIGGEGFGIALSAGLGGSEFSLTGRADNADIDSKYLALHGNFALTNGLRGAAGLSYAWHDVATSRALAAPVAQVLTAQTDARTVQIFGEIGYEAQLGSVALTPFARLAHVGTRSVALAETGGAAALAVRRITQDATFLSLGARTTFGAADARFKPYAGIAWNRAFGDRRASAASTFTSGGPGFVISGMGIPEDSAEVDAGLDFTTGRLSIGAGYNGVLAGDRTVHGGRISARLVF